MKGEIRAPAVLEVSDPDLGLKGWLAVDSVIDDHFCGGVRMLPDVSALELKELARAMTLKHGFLGIPHGGAKAGIVCNVAASREQKMRLLLAFGRSLEDLLARRVYLPGCDMGTTDDDIREMLGILGIRVSKRASRGRQSGWYTSLTVIASAREACRFQGFDLGKARVAIEGFGQVGSSVAQGLDRMGSQIVAVSTSHGAIYSPRGLDVAELLGALQRCGSEALNSYRDADRIDRESLLHLDVDVLIPCARHHSIREDNVERIRAKVVSPGANVPATRGAERRLAMRGVLCVPDFMANAGAVLGGTMEFAGLGPSAIVSFVNKHFARQVHLLIDEARRQDVCLRELAERVAMARFGHMQEAAAVRSLPRRAFAFGLDLYRNGRIPQACVRTLAGQYFRRRIEGRL